MVISGAERCSGDFGDTSLMRTPAQSGAALESPRARVPYIAGYEFSPATALRSGAPTIYWKCCLRAYGHSHSRAGTPRKKLPNNVHKAILPLDVSRLPANQVDMRYALGKEV